MGLSVGVLRPKSDFVQHFPNLCFSPGFGHSTLDPQGLLQNPADGMGRIQAAVGVLKHHLRGGGGMEKQLPGVVPEKPHNGPGEGGFPATALTHQSQNLALVQGKGDVLQNLFAPFSGG